MKTIIGGTAAIVIAVALVFAGRPDADEVQAGQAGANRMSIVGAGPAAGSVTHDNAVLGYRISLPDTYRRSQSALVAGPELLGFDTYTSLTQTQDRDRCLTDQGNTPAAPSGAYFSVEVHRNDAGVSATQWTSTRRTTQRRTVQPVMVNGAEAARQVEDGKTTSPSKQTLTRGC